MTDRPRHVLVIMSDQHHRDFMGVAGHPRVRTPHLDALAARGRWCSHAYCPFPLCGPSRASFMTGRQPQHTGVLANHTEFRGDMPTFAHGFGAAGYETVLSGRMHFVGLDQRHGFERRLIGDVPASGYIAAGWALEAVLGELRDTPGMGLQGLTKSGAGRSGYLAYDEAVTATTTAYLRERRDDRPLLLVVGYVMPHCPFVADPEDYALYDGVVPLPTLTDADLADQHPYTAAQRRRYGTSPLPDPATRRRVATAYHGMVTHLDRQVGQVLAALADAGMADQTLVLYTSDHGEQLGEHGCWWKSTFYNGSIGVPLVAAGPGIAPAPAPITANVSLTDIGPTLLELAGLEPLPDVDGRSVAGLLQGRGVDGPDRVYGEYVDSPGQPGTPQRMVKDGPWKYVYYHGQPPQLFHDDDPGESVDHARDPAQAERLAAMRALALDGWDPEAVAALHAERLRQATLVGRWGRAAVAKLELDPPWFDAPPPNHWSGNGSAGELARR